jgi:hypothetical protein
MYGAMARVEVIIGPERRRRWSEEQKRAFRRLPPKQRSAVLLSAIEGKSYSEAANLMGVSRSMRCAAIWHEPETGCEPPCTAATRKTGSGCCKSERPYNPL